MPVRPDVRAACEILGFDPLYVANEGRLVAFVRDQDVDVALAALRRHPDGAGAARIGSVVKTPVPPVTSVSAIGAKRILDRLTGEQLPRIC